MLECNKSFLKFALFLGIVFMVSGCTAKSNRLTTPDSPLDNVGETPPYRLAIGDMIEVRFLFTSDLNREVMIRPDGKITLDIVGEIDAMNLSLQELTDRLSEMYSAELRDPSITVTLTQPAPKRVYVAGEVNSPGIYNIEAGLTALQAIFSAGGVTENGKLSSVIILRKDTSTAVGGKICRVDLVKVIKGRKNYFDYPLNAFDVIYVPRSCIASVDLFVDQYIRRVLPISLNAGFSYVTRWEPES